MKPKPGKKMKVGAEKTEMITEMIMSTCEEEWNCDTVFDNLDIYAEYLIHSGTKTKMIEMIEDHLSKCGDCAEEFQLLLKALRSAEG